MNRREFGQNLLGALGMLAAGPAGAWAMPSLRAPRIDGVRLVRHLAALAEFGKEPAGGVSRVAYSDADREGRRYVMELMRAAGLETRVDAAGNILGRRAGTEASLPPLAFGSHIDSVPNGGNYDGPVGSLSAIEAVQTLEQGGVRTRHPLEVIVFANEEGGLFGSRALSGELKAAELDRTTHSGKTVRQGIEFIGGDPSRLDEVVRGPGDVAAFLELHIEQGGVLEAEGVHIGVVEGIVGIHWWDVTVEGFANHAGTTPMDQRQDALLAAARFIDMVNRVITSTPGRQVGTVGRIQATPGAPNVIPGRVVTSLEIRDLDAEKMRRLFEEIERGAREIGEATGTTFSFQETFASLPAPTDPRLREMIERSAAELGLTSRRMPSGAGHDAQSMSRFAPMAMIFVPSVGGISHSPEEFTRPEDVVNGANVLLSTLLHLDAML